MMCPDGAVDSPVDPETERAEMLASIEQRADVHEVYEGANIVYTGRGARGPQRRVRQYSYDCSRSK